MKSIKVYGIHINVLESAKSGVDMILIYMSLK